MWWVAFISGGYNWAERRKTTLKTQFFIRMSRNAQYSIQFLYFIFCMWLVCLFTHLIPWFIYSTIIQSIRWNNGRFFIKIFYWTIMCCVCTVHFYWFGYFFLSLVTDWVLKCACGSIWILSSYFSVNTRNIPVYVYSFWNTDQCWYIFFFSSPLICTKYREMNKFTFSLIRAMFSCVCARSHQ